MLHTSQPFHLMIKPAGSACNLACEYCYYLEKAALYPEGTKCRMDEETLERVTAAYLQASPGPEVTFGWQGGEPLLMGVDFYRKALEFQAKYARPGLRVVNALQTNGTLVNDEWAAFFVEHNFLVGISIDGPPDLHDTYRRNRDGQCSYERVVAGLRMLQEHKVEHNVLVTVNRTNAEHPLRVYRHLTEELGVDFLQFIPIVERVSRASTKVTPWTVRPAHLGRFFCEIFDYWARHDVGRVFVQIFESALNVWMGGRPTLCTFSPICGWGLAVEHNGDLYACDHFVYPDYLRGAITPDNLRALVASPEQRAFGKEKANLPGECRQCRVLPFCGGDCPKHRLRAGQNGVPISFLCPAYQQLFTHSAQVLQAMANEVRAGRPASNVMEVLNALG